MGETKQYQLERYSISLLNFQPINIVGEIDYGASFSAETNSDNRSLLRIPVNIILKDSESQEVFLNTEVTGYFTQISGPYTFDFHSNEEKELLRMILDEIKYLIYFISGKGFDKPMSIDFDLDTMLREMELMDTEGTDHNSNQN